LAPAVIVALGLVASLNRPGANLTGIANLSAELAPKQLQLLRELMPNAAVFGVLVDPAFPTTQSTIADLQVAARTLGLQLVVINARTDSEVEVAFASFSQHRVGAVFVGISSFFTRRTRYNSRRRRPIMRYPRFLHSVSSPWPVG
jgi:putative ABC transport system substrate-binding protein